MANPQQGALFSEPSEEQLLKQFMEEQFDFDGLRKMGIYPKGMKRADYKAQAERICQFFGYKTVYEYGAKEIRCHLTYAGPRPMHVDEHGELKPEPFITVIPSIYDSK